VLKGVLLHLWIREVRHLISSHRDIMHRYMLRAKLHRAVITQANLDYEGSLTIDRDLMDAVGLVPFEQVKVYNINNGERFDTYVIEGQPGSGVIGLTGQRPDGGCAVTGLLLPHTAWWRKQKWLLTSPVSCYWIGTTA